MPANVGQLKQRLKFEYREAVADDGYGNRDGKWILAFQLWARILPLRGSETVIAARLSGVQPVIITVRVSTPARKITTDWRAWDANTGVVYNIRSGANYDEHNRYIDFMAEAGVPF